MDFVKEFQMFLSKRKNGIYHPNYINEKGDRNERKIMLITLKDFTLEFLKYSEIVQIYFTNHTYKQTFKFFNKYYPKKLLIYLINI